MESRRRVNGQEKYYIRVQPGGRWVRLARGANFHAPVLGGGGAASIARSPTTLPDDMFRHAFEETHVQMERR